MAKSNEINYDYKKRTFQINFFSIKSIGARRCACVWDAAGWQNSSKTIYLRQLVAVCFLVIYWNRNCVQLLFWYNLFGSANLLGHFFSYISPAAKRCVDNGQAWTLWWERRKYNKRRKNCEQVTSTTNRRRENAWLIVLTCTQWT